MADCVFSVIFPNNMPYFNAYCHSLSLQSDKDFSVLLFNDGVLAEEISAVLSLYPWVKVSVKEVSGSIPSVREIAINQLCNTSFDNIHFLDTDDFIPANYIEIKRDLLKEFAVVVADLSTTDQNGQILKNGKISSRLPDGFIIEQDFLYHKNIMGMSNTSLRRNILFPIQVPENLIAVDWFVFFNLMRNRKAIFTSKTCTYYRQHGANTLGDNNITKDVLLRKTQAMLNNAEALAGKYKEFENQLPALKMLLEELKSNDNTIALAQKNLFNTEIDYFWFEDISLLLRK